MGASNTDL